MARAPIRRHLGVTNLNPDPATATALGDAGLSIAPLGSASAAGTRVSFPVSGGAIDPETAAGRVAHSGGLAFWAGGATVRVRNVIVPTTVPGGS